MSDQQTDPVALFDRFPDGHVVAVFEGRRYGVSSRRQVGGRSRNLYAEELGGTDVVSANLYVTASGAVIKPCEMPAAKVLDFLSNADVEQ